METLSLSARASFEAVMRLYTPTVYGIAYTRLHDRADAEDVTQNVFIRYYNANLTYESEDHRKAWLIRCAVNCTNSFASSAQYRHRAASISLDELAENTAHASGSAEELAERSQRKTEVLDAVMKLPPKYRTVIHLFYFEDMSVAQIANVLKMREPTVKSQLSRARVKLKAILKAEVEF